NRRRFFTDQRNAVRRQVQAAAGVRHQKAVLILPRSVNRPLDGHPLLTAPVSQDQVKLFAVVSDPSNGSHILAFCDSTRPAAERKSLRALVWDGVRLGLTLAELLVAALRWRDCGR